MAKIFQLPIGIDFVNKVGEDFAPNIFSINNWVEGSLETGIKAFYFGIPTEDGQLNFRIPMEDLEVFYGGGGVSHLIYIGNDEELLKTLKSNSKRLCNEEKPCPMEFQH